MNTKISYLYRDAANYKVRNECIINGELNYEQIRQIIDCCDECEYFMPSQVGLPERKFDDYDAEVDHCWFEINEYCFEQTEQPANALLTARQLLENFALCKGNWKDDRQAEFDHAYETGLSEYLQHDLDAYEEGLKTIQICWTVCGRAVRQYQRRRDH